MTAEDWLRSADAFAPSSVSSYSTGSEFVVDGLHGCVNGRRSAIRAQGRSTERRARTTRRPTGERAHIGTYALRHSAHRRPVRCALRRRNCAFWRVVRVVAEPALAGVHGGGSPQSIPVLARSESIWWHTFFARKGVSWSRCLRRDTRRPRTASTWRTSPWATVCPRHARSHAGPRARSPRLRTRTPRTECHQLTAASAPYRSLFVSRGSLCACSSARVRPW
jgi:hypothetical protein